MAADPYADALIRCQRALDEKPGLLTLGKRVVRIVNDNASFRSRAKRVYQLADEMAASLASYVTCHDGCSHCCYLPTMVYQHEADMMAVAGQRTAKQLADRPRSEALESTLSFFGEPCPFLVNNRCSIYASRPLICRIHHSFNDTTSACDTRNGKDGEARVMVDPDDLELPYTALVMNCKKAEAWGCIQEFFPSA